MIQEEALDVRTITLGISLLDCAHPDIDVLNENIYKKITTVAKDLVKVGQQLERELGIPIVNKRISVTPIAIVASLINVYPLNNIPVDKLLAFFISIIAFTFNPYLSHNPIIGTVSINRQVVLFVTNASPNVLSISPMLI